MNITGYALCTGAGSGIGKACAIAYAREGAAGVVLADINLEAARLSAEESKRVASNGNFKALPLQVDIGHEKSVEAMVQATIKEFGRIDYAVNSAGIGVEKPSEVSESSEAEFTRFMNINVTGALLVVREVTKRMKENTPSPWSSLEKPEGRGSVVILGSANSYMATPGIVPYTASKHAVLGLTRNAGMKLSLLRN